MVKWFGNNSSYFHNLLALRKRFSNHCSTTYVSSHIRTETCDWELPGDVLHLKTRSWWFVLLEDLILQPWYLKILHLFLVGLKQALNLSRWLNFTEKTCLIIVILDIFYLSGVKRLFCLKVTFWHLVIFHFLKTLKQSFRLCHMMEFPFFRGLSKPGSRLHYLFDCRTQTSVFEDWCRYLCVYHVPLISWKHI